MKPTDRVLDVLSFVAGPAVLVASVFNFSFAEVLGDNSVAVAYQYKHEVLVYIAAGVALVSFGLLRRSWANRSAASD